MAGGFCDWASDLADEYVKFFGKFNLKKNGNQSCSSDKIFSLAEMTFGLVHA